MKTRIILYLLVFSAIINVYLIVNDGKVLKTQTEEITQLKKNQDSLVMYRNMYKEASFFSINENKNAQKYFDQDYKLVMDKVLQDLSALNTQEKGNPLLPVAVSGKKTVIYKATVLNHQWIIAAYKNDYSSGEVLIQYLYDDAGETTFKVIKQLEY